MKPHPAALLPHVSVNRREMIQAGALGLLGATLPDLFRSQACAGKAAEFTHSKPSRLPERLPLPHEIPKWMLEDYEQRLEQDQREHPERYGRPRPKPRLVTP